MKSTNKVELRTPQEIEDRLRQNLERRKLPDCFLYVGNSGAKNWLDLEQSADFTVASRLTELLRSHAETIGGTLPPACDLVSIGVGDGRKERILLEALLPEWTGCYLAVDVSSDLVDAALQRVADLDIDAQGIVALCEDLPDLRRHWTSPVTLCLLGNNFCNYHPHELLGMVSSGLGPKDGFLFDAHLCPEDPESEDVWRRRVEGAYGSEKNVRFNMWPLIAHGVSPDACRFEIGLTQADTPAGTTYRTQKSIRILERSTLTIDDSEIELAPGEIIEMGFTYKYTLDHLHELLSQQGFEVVREFFDRIGENTLMLVETC